jgi:hypothetical protein
MREGLGGAQRVRGANFIGRMDDTTVRALASSGMSYYVDFMEHRFAPFRYREMPTGPMRVWTREGEVWRVPISVETNNRPWPTVRSVLDSALRHATRSGNGHVNMLLHPFRDGASQHLKMLRSMLGYIRDELGCTAVRLRDFVTSLPRHQFQCAIHYKTAWPGSAVAGRRWWTDRNNYERRVGGLYEVLQCNGLEPALALDPLAGKPTYSVFPALAEGTGEIRFMTCDPLSRETLESTVRSIAQDSDFNCQFVPNGRSSDVLNRLRDTAPHTFTDLARILPEFATRLVFKLTPGRHVF